MIEKENNGQVSSRPEFYIYKDADYSGNHYKPTGYMGDTGH